MLRLFQFIGLAVAAVLIAPSVALARCSIAFTSPERGSTVTTPTVTVEGKASGFATTSAVGTAIATVNGVAFFQYQGLFTSTLSFGGGSSATATLKPGANELTVSGNVSECHASDSMVIHYLPPPVTEQKSTGEPVYEVCSNPINGSAGNTNELVIDYGGLPSGLLAFERYYNSKNEQDGTLGKGWRHNYERSFSNTGTSFGSRIYLQRPDGKYFTFQNTSTGWVSDGDMNDRLIETAVDGQIQWQFQYGEEKSLEIYNSAYQLIAIVLASGRRVDLSYDNRGRLVQVQEGLSQHKLTLAYVGNTAKLNSVTDPADQVYNYRYADGMYLSSVSHSLNPSASPHYLFSCIASQQKNPVVVYQSH